MATDPAAQLTPPAEGAANDSVGPDTALAVTAIGDDEVLFRAVTDHANHHATDPSGMLLRLSQSAFNDRDRTPSVDRAQMRVGGPMETCLNESDGVVSLRADEVRSIKHIKTLDAKQQPKVEHAVDVVHRPLAENHSHGQIEAAPEIQSDGTWRRLKEALCRAATRRGWVHRPASARDTA